VVLRGAARVAELELLDPEDRISQLALTLLASKFSGSFNLRLKWP
jgi:hypothetical protein